MEIPGILSNYNYYLDIKEDPKTHEILRSGYLSTTALQALSMGLKVIDADERIYTEFPAENDVESVATMCMVSMRRSYRKEKVPNSDTIRHLRKQCTGIYWSEDLGKSKWRGCS